MQSRSHRRTLAAWHRSVTTRQRATPSEGPVGCRGVAGALDTTEPSRAADTTRAACKERGVGGHGYKICKRRLLLRSTA